ncbi:hypothetical protein NDU88_002571 [Pleurodeles waltl]|uniref:Uncharacterized protein n=1 Tax=Pleurodeles waltl TaxID=8319 RepID=A0AAV7M1C9_PLEWA|nr:hypothetical protein NDU88_002571 [Pleurodeles waltl]
MCFAFQSGLNWLSGAGQGCTILPSGSSAQSAAGGEDRRGSNLGTQLRLFRLPPPSQLPCSVTQFSSAACAVTEAPLAQATSHLQAALSHGPRGRKAASSPMRGAPRSTSATSRGTNFQCGLRSRNATPPQQYPGGSTPGSLGSLSLPASDSSCGGAARPPFTPN